MGMQEALDRIGTDISLPSLPDIVLKINARVDDPTVGLKELGEIASDDPALTARIIRLANSSFYGLTEPVGSAEAAAAVVGARALRNVAMQVSILKEYEHLSSVPDFDLEGVWSHAMQTARLSQSLASRCEKRTGQSSDDFYACGLLHDVGKVILLENLDQEYLEVLSFTRRAVKALHQAEEELLGFTHVHVGAILAREWALPEKIAQAIEFHHGPRDEIVSHPHVAVVAIADQVAYRSESVTFESALPRLAKLAESILGLSGEEFSGAIEEAREDPSAVPG